MSAIDRWRLILFTQTSLPVVCVLLSDCSAVYKITKQVGRRGMKRYQCQRRYRKPVWRLTWQMKPGNLGGLASCYVVAPFSRFK